MKDAAKEKRRDTVWTWRSGNSTDPSLTGFPMFHWHTDTLNYLIFTEILWFQDLSLMHTHRHTLTEHMRMQWNVLFTAKRLYKPLATIPSLQA